MPVTTLVKYCLFLKELHYTLNLRASLDCISPRNNFSCTVMTCLFLGREQKSAAATGVIFVPSNNQQAAVVSVSWVLVTLMLDMSLWEDYVFSTSTSIFLPSESESSRKIADLVLSIFIVPLPEDLPLFQWMH